MIATTEVREHKFKVRVVYSPHMPNPSKIKDEPFSWEEIKFIIQNNKLEYFARSKDETERYLKIKEQIKKDNMTVFKHILVESLQWYDPSLNNGVPDNEISKLKDNEIVFRASSNKLFSDANDIKILKNDFPYHFDKDIQHLCIWSKVRIQADPDSIIGDISPQTRRLIDRYVEKTFIEKLGIPRENLVWFRNWEALQSVKSISHIHVIIKGMTEKQMRSILYGPGVPLTPEEYELLSN